MSKIKQTIEWFLCLYFCMLAITYMGSSPLVAAATFLCAATVCPLHDLWIRKTNLRHPVIREILAAVFFFAAVAITP